MEFRPEAGAHIFNQLFPFFVNTIPEYLTTNEKYPGLMGKVRRDSPSTTHPICVNVNGAFSLRFLAVSMLLLESNRAAALHSRSSALWTYTCSTFLLRAESES